MSDHIMQFGVVLFFILFIQLIFIFALFIIARFKRKKYTKPFTPPISIIIPTYNESKIIGKCLDAVLHAQYPHKQIIVVDDGSTDDTRDIVKLYANSYASHNKKQSTTIILLRQNHLGKVHALNLATKNAAHDFIISIDADTIVEPEFFIEMMKPFADKSVGAVSGEVLVENKSDSLLSRFQVLEYAYNNLIRASFSSVLDSGIWFFGCLGGYRKSVLKKIGGFKTDTMAEDMDVAVETYACGYKAINVPAAVGYTVVPTKYRQLFRQRSRWWGGGLQTIIKHKQLLSKKSSLAVKYLFYSHLWWAVYAFLALPIFAYQIWYWWPAGTIATFAAYLFRWFSFAGPVYTLYMNYTGTWAWSTYNIFGILSGVISAIMLVFALVFAREKEWLKNVLCIFFYFPYTLVLNIIMAGSVIHFIRRARAKKNGHFIK